MKIGLLSDTHGWLDSKILDFFKDCDEVWHCGDIGDLAVTDRLTHIGGYPGHYDAGIRTLLYDERPQLFVCGHSHILKVMFDKTLGCLHINPGAAGKYGFHKVRTAIRFVIEKGKMKDLEVLELEKK